MNFNKCYVLFLIVLNLLCSCHNDNDKLSDERLVGIVVKYEDQTELHIDKNAKIYVYYGVYSTDIADFTFFQDGTLVLKENKIVPDVKTAFEGEERIELTLKSTEKITIIAESSYFSNKLIVQSYSPSGSPIKDIYIFKSE